MLSVGESSMGQTPVQLAWPWQRKRASSESSKGHRFAPAPSRLSAMSVNARLRPNNLIFTNFNLTFGEAYPLKKAEKDKTILGCRNGSC